MTRRNHPRLVLPQYVTAVLLFGVVIILLTARDFHNAGLRLTFDHLLRPDVSDAERVYGHLTRTTIQLAAMALTVTAIAVPLTANLYTPRLIDLFVRDRWNRAFLLLLMFSTFLTHYTLYVLRDNEIRRFAPYNLMALTALGGSACMILALPYIYRMFRLLAPETIILRMREQIVAEIDQAIAADTPWLREHIADVSAQLGEIALRACSREDSRLAITVLDELEHVAQHYRQVKARLPESWFQGYHGVAASLPPEAVEHLRTQRTWFEFHLTKSLEALLPTAMAQTPDVVSRLGRATRVLAVTAASADDPAVVAQTLKFFNTFLRQAINRRNNRGYYHISNEYRRLGQQLLSAERPWTIQIGESLAYYAHEADRIGADFQRDFALYDLADLLVAVDQRKPDRAAVLFMNLVGAYHSLSAARLEPAVKVLAYSLASNCGDYCRRLQQIVTNHDASEVWHAVSVVLAATGEEYREVTDRVVDVNYVPEPWRQALLEWAEREVGDPLAAPPAGE